MGEHVMEPDEAEVAAIFERLRAEVRGGPRADGAGSEPAPFTETMFMNARREAERSWTVTAERPFLSKPGRWGRVRGLLLTPPKIVIRKLMRWYVEPALAQEREYNAAVLKALDALSARIDTLAGLNQSSQAKLKEVAGAIVPLERLVDELEGRLVRVERRTRPRRDVGDAPSRESARPDSFRALPDGSPDYFAFEARMRGSTKLIRERQSIYLKEFTEAAPVLDIGCGRGEFLALLREAGIEARGIDIDAEMVATCGDAGLRVEQADAVSYLEALEDGSLGGIFCAHVLEHLPLAKLLVMLELSAVKLRSSGLFVAETPNPLSLIALASFSADLSHDRPLHPASLSFLLRQAGFRDVALRFLSEPPDEERLRHVPLPGDQVFDSTREALDANVHRLNEVVFGPQDYAVLART